MLNIVFYYIGSEMPSYAEYFIKSIRKSMPRANVVQLTDETTPAFNGVDMVRRSVSEFPVQGATINYIGYQYLAEMNITPVIFADPDMMFNGDISPLMDAQFDVAIATRDIIDDVPYEHIVRYPWCSMMIVKNPLFWRDCFHTLLKNKERTWFDNMEAVRDVIKSGKYKVMILEGNVFNALPVHYRDDVKVYHCKGDYKEYMQPFWEEYFEGGVQ